MYCVKCGKQIDDDVKFCPNCGQVIGKEFARTNLNKVNTRERRKKSGIEICIYLSTVSCIVSAWLLLHFSNQPGLFFVSKPGEDESLVALILSYGALSIFVFALSIKALTGAARVKDNSAGRTMATIALVLALLACVVLPVAATIVSYILSVRSLNESFDYEKELMEKGNNC